jgi:hypothetical protein
MFWATGKELSTTGYLVDIVAAVECGDRLSMSNDVVHVARLAPYLGGGRNQHP